MFFHCSRMKKLNSLSAAQPFSSASSWLGFYFLKHFCSADRKNLIGWVEPQWAGPGNHLCRLLNHQWHHELHHSLTRLSVLLSLSWTLRSISLLTNSSYLLGAPDSYLRPNTRSNYLKCQKMSFCVHEKEQLAWTKTCYWLCLLYFCVMEAAGDVLLFRRTVWKKQCWTSTKGRFC